jgi:hypothetical protein
MFVVPLRPVDAVALAALGKALSPAAAERHTILATKNTHRIRLRRPVFNRG